MTITSPAMEAWKSRINFIGSGWVKARESTSTSRPRDPTTSRTYMSQTPQVITPILPEPFAQRFRGLFSTISSRAGMRVSMMVS